VAGCDTRPAPPGDHYASFKRVYRWMGGSAAAGAVLTYLNIVGMLGAAPLGGGAALIAVAAILVGAAAGAVLGFFVGFMVEWFFNRLKEQNPRTITIQGLIVCAGKNTGVPPLNDNDWTFNMSADFRVLGPLEPGLDPTEVRTRAAPDSGLSQAFPTSDPENGDVQVFHCEIGSRMGDYAAVGGAVGSVAGAIAGIAIGAAICAGLAIATLGLALAVCALIVAALALAGAFVGGVVGDLLGAGLGWIVDALSDFDERGEAVEEGCVMCFTGRWVTDIGHQHNEIHDVESAQLLECGIDSTEGGLGVAGTVGIGRQPTGRDP
jgi:hypothetical protein